MNKLKQHRGFTLIELIMALLLLAVIGSLLFTVISAYRGNPERRAAQEQEIVSFRAELVEKCDSKVVRAFELKVADAKEGVGKRYTFTPTPKTIYAEALLVCAKNSPSTR